MMGIQGDTHGKFSAVADAAEKVYAKGGKALLHVGDFGIHRDMIAKMSNMKFNIPVYVIDGNHEDFRIINTYSKDELTEIRPNVFYVPRGIILNIDDRVIGFCGGAASVDKEWQLRNTAYHGTVTWYPEEAITDEDIAKFDHIDHVDMLITHVPPQCTIQAHFDPKTLEFFGLPQSWRDPSADKIEALWVKLGKPMLVAGHMHRSVVDQMGKVRILGINELIFV